MKCPLTGSTLRRVGHRNLFPGISQAIAVGYHYEQDTRYAEKIQLVSVKIFFIKIFSNKSPVKNQTGA